MAMKKKKADRKPSMVPDKRKAAVGSAGTMTAGALQEPPQQILGGISRSVGDLIRRTKGYLGSGKKAEA